MRILHTSDWHLGRQLHRVPLLAEQRAFLEHLLGTVRQERVQVVAVAGDVSRPRWCAGGFPRARSAAS
ncbi:exonuclease SbcCD subunit D [[Kitasatospora] papulosa]|uniref:metallophosphoesterase family protein n=1 Tax=[Kitasatospora] papulosa TaxID=1464011 RepID=UPI0036A33951